VRENRGGILNTLVYGRLIARHIDPIEKKPLFHFLPGSLSYSIATVGCNFRCRFCQNADIADAADGRSSSAASQCEIVTAAGGRVWASPHLPGHGFRVRLKPHTGPRRASVRFVTSGYMTRKPWR
jgi:pyruvate-formate lyase-activating enzyme